MKHKISNSRSQGHWDEPLLPLLLPDPEFRLLVRLYHILTTAAAAKLLQSCPTLNDPMECSLPGFSIHGIFQATVLEWVVISFSRGSSWPRDQTQVSGIAERCLTLGQPTSRFKKSTEKSLVNSNLESLFEKGSRQCVHSTGEILNCNFGGSHLTIPESKRISSLVCMQKCSSHFTLTFLQCCLFYLVSHIFC